MALLDAEESRSDVKLFIGHLSLQDDEFVLRREGSVPQGFDDGSIGVFKAGVFSPIIHTSTHPNNSTG